LAIITLIVDTFRELYEWCICDVSRRAMHDAHLEWKAEYNKLLNICSSIHYSRIAMNGEAVVKGLDELDAYFRQENVN
jgi:hypothetical protein